MAQALCEILRLEKYEVDHYANGLDGLTAIESDIYDIIILDVMLPGMNGYEIANVVTCPVQGDTATLEHDRSATITGSTFISTGASGMAQTFSESKQGVTAVSVGNQSAGTNITLKDKNGKTIITYAPELSFAVMILSSPDIVSGKTYTI